MVTVNMSKMSASQKHQSSTMFPRPFLVFFFFLILSCSFQQASSLRLVRFFNNNNNNNNKQDVSFSKQTLEDPALQSTFSLTTTTSTTADSLLSRPTTNRKYLPPLPKIAASFLSATESRDQPTKKKRIPSTLLWLIFLQLAGFLSLCFAFLIDLDPRLTYPPAGKVNDRGPFGNFGA